MGCGKSKHDVASGNTTLQHNKSSMSSKASHESGIEIKDINNHNVDNVSSQVQVEQMKSESVKESNVEVKDDEVVNDVKGEVENTNVQKEREVEKMNVQEEKEVEKTNVQEEKKEVKGEEGKTKETIIVGGQFESDKFESEKDDSSKENEQKINDVDTITPKEEKMPTQNEQEDGSVKIEEDMKDKCFNL